MVQRGLSLGLFGRFGRSAALRQLDGALRAVDLHPYLVPEAVKLTAVRLLKEHAPAEEPAPQAYPAAAIAWSAPNPLPAPMTRHLPRR